MHIIGPANDFWRLRLTRIDTTEDLDFEWHEDILYREPVIRDTERVEVWNVEAIRTDDFDVVVALGTFPDRLSADAFYARAQEDLVEMTKSEFEAAYLKG